MLIIQQISQNEMTVVGSKVMRNYSVLAALFEEQLSSKLFRN